MKIKDGVANDKKFFIKEVKGELMLKRNHDYYYQCQGILNILGIEWIDLVVYRLNDHYIEIIFRDKTPWLSKMLPNMYSIFTEFILPAI